MLTTDTLAMRARALGAVHAMKIYAKDAPRLDKVILTVACGLAALVLLQMGFWESRQQDVMDKLADIIAMQQAELAEIREMVRTNRRELDRDR
jgi:hypothetical protein